MSNGGGFRPPPKRRGAPSLVRYLRSCAHFWMSAVLLGSAFSMHFEYFWNCAGLGLLPEPPEPPEEPGPPGGPGAAAAGRAAAAAQAAERALQLGDRLRVRRRGHGL